MDRKIKWYL